ncbi:plasma protease C1 inhibitor isoform X1 [Falco biarmicus]|uniref:plasma protease C1 inhibitor isoform X1 n=1 Tax=Falco biarmicus TaxID=345155 RepID=UPI0024BC54CE|nr:plasma protease C1 inhibitor isoform X1 [Falco biarmicus]XP_056210605.1 plasma protease C1 inhibitor isoform X1 [Falco biarmicus]XP_056210606.1 plasma protease C1 inhibitor isoform X1 [Falco biarmicus]
MATMTLWLPLVWWLVATATATVTQVPSPEAPPSWLKLLRQFLSLLVPPCPNAGPPGDVGAPILPGPPPATHLQELPGLDAPLKAADAPSPKVPEGAPEELGTVAHGSTAAPTPSSTQEAPGTSAPPCPGDEEPAEVCGTPTAEQRTAVAEALGTFALRFYQRMAEAVQPDANLLFSPLNIAMGLSHLLLGARGETRERLGAILVYPPELGCVHSALQQLASVPGLFSAAQIFHHPGLHLRPRFLNESWHIYGTRPWELSGNESLDLLRINAWVREASRGLLPSLLPTLPPQSRLLLLSAIHLQATWRTPLKAKQTVPLPFLRPGRPPRLVPTMTSKKYPVASFIDPHLQVQVGRMELSGGMSLVVLVPQGAPGALGTLEQALDPPAFRELLRRAARTPPRATALALPRLRLDRALDVVAVVHDMDYGLFLDAELCGLAQGPAVMVDAVRHRAVLALDEAGVEAASAMATSVARTALVLEALRPFLFVLWHDASAIPLFMGRLSDPQP